MFTDVEEIRICENVRACGGETRKDIKRCGCSMYLVFFLSRGKGVYKCSRGYGGGGVPSKIIITCIYIPMITSYHFM